MSVFWGGIEAGGQHFVCAVSTGPGDLLVQSRYETGTPVETLSQAIEFFKSARRHNEIAGIGIASFGPLDLDPKSSTYGFITSTPKAGWGNTDFAGTIHRALQLPVSFDTDVNAAALGEHVWGAGEGLDSVLYVTVGTGIGGGAIIGGSILHGMLHPEMGHVRVSRDPQVDDFPGICPFHGDCLEGLASGPAIEQRWSSPPEQLPSDHAAWDLEAGYLGTAIANLVYTLSPQRIVIGGGVMRQPRLLPLVRREVRAVLNGYVRAPDILERIDDYIVAPQLGDRAGVLGAIALARQAGGARI